MVITVTGIDTSAAKSTSDVTVLSASDIEASAASALDDLLRIVPGFNTFRRSSSIVTAPAEDPEAQGVTLRGIGPGGASRALVLLDGIPINDAFGGWIYWDEIPLDQIERIEVVNGGGSNLWGSGAEGGVINLIPKTPAGNGAQARGSFGNRGTTDDALSGSYQKGPFLIGLEGNLFNTAGWNIIDPRWRGPIDHNSSSIHELGSGIIEYHQRDTLSGFLRGSYYHEERDLGTRFRQADATRGFVNGGGRMAIPGGGDLKLSLYAHLSDFDENFSAANARRTAERRTVIQQVRAMDAGGSIGWTRSLSVHNQIVTGGDFRLIDGKSADTFFNTAGTAVSDHKTSSGRQNFFGLFVEDVYRPAENFEIDLSTRGDFLQNLDGRIRDRPAGAPVSTAVFPNRMRAAVSPKLAARYSPRRWLTLRAGVYQAFRAPTLAELYRQSSVENLRLLPNPKLSPEFLTGGEAGIELRPWRGVKLALIGYWDILHKPISNVVTATDPITGSDTARTRENLGRARVRGYEVKLAYRTRAPDWGRWQQFNPELALTADYLRSEAKLLYNPPDPTLEGRRLSLVPWNSGSGGISYRDDLLGEAALDLIYQDMQWEDSDNHDRQRAYWLANLTLSRRLPELPVARWIGQATAYLKIQNLLDRSCVIDRGGGIPKLGMPFLVEAGVIAPFGTRG